jgi:chemotaxis protein CheD
MRCVVGVSEMKLSASADDLIVTHGLGSCLGVAIYDPVARVGGLLHAMLPTAKMDPARAEKSPCMFVDTGVPLLFREAYALGALKSRLVVKVAGGASLRHIGGGPLAIGQRNLVVLHRLFWRNGILVAAEEVGGSVARTMSIEVDSGRVLLTASGATYSL